MCQIWKWIYLPENKNNGFKGKRSKKFGRSTKNKYYIIYGLKNEYKPKFWWFMYSYLKSIIKLSDQLLVVRTNFGDPFLHSGKQLEGTQGRYPVLINKFFRCWYKVWLEIPARKFSGQLFLNPQYMPVSPPTHTHHISPPPLIFHPPFSP